MRMRASTAIARLLIGTLLAVCLLGCEDGEKRAPPADEATAVLDAPRAEDMGGSAAGLRTSRAPDAQDVPTPLREQQEPPEGQHDPRNAPSDLAWIDEITGAQVDESAVAHAIYVDAARGDDDAAGAKGQPLRTLAAAAALAVKHLEAGEGVRIRLAPGTYREEVAFWPDDSPPINPPLVIDGAARGQVILSGSDDWSDPERWQPIPGMPGVLGTSWKHDWGDEAVDVSGRPEGEHPPGGVRGFAPDDGTAVIEWMPPAGLADAAGYRVYRRKTSSLDGPPRGAWQEVARLGPKTGRLVDETARPTGPSEAYRYEYRVATLDGKGRERGTSPIISIEPGVPDGTSRPTAVGRRREMVFVDGQPLRQVASIKDLAPGTFYADDGWATDPDDGRLYLALPQDVRRGEATIEVAVRPGLRNDCRPLVLSTHGSIVLRNLTVQHYAVAPHWGAATEIEDCAHVLIEDCTFRWNNTAGLRLGICETVTLRRCAAEHNGRAGITWGACANLLAEDIRVSHNNWRGDWGGIHGGRVAGLKFGFMDHSCRIRRVTATQNACPGVWVAAFGSTPSPPSARMLIEELTATENAREGLIVSDSHSPIHIRDAVLARNGRTGLLLAATSGGTLEGSTLYANRRSQIEVLPSDPFADNHHPTLGVASGRSVRDWPWREHAVVSVEADAPPVRAPAEAAFIRTLRSDHNLWHGPDEGHAFHLAGMGFPLEAWQQVTGQDLGSRFIDPRFRNAEALDFTPRGDSPLRRRDAWPSLAAMPANLARLASFRAARAEATTAPPYPALTQVKNLRWRLVDLRPVANRPLTGEDAWLDTPLPELAPGKRTIHGVPFDLIDERTAGGYAAVVLPSARVRTTRGKELPREVTVPVGRRARTIYILHGCARGDRFAPAARYELVYADGTTAGVDVVPLGEAPKDEARLDQRKRLANIQDTRPEFVQFASDRARRAMILDPDDPAGRLRYLYTFRWPNPHPAKVIRSVRLASSDPEQEVTVGILAITLRLED